MFVKDSLFEKCALIITYGRTMTDATYKFAEGEVLEGRQAITTVLQRIPTKRNSVIRFAQRRLRDEDLG